MVHPPRHEESWELILRNDTLDPGLDFRALADTDGDSDLHLNGRVLLAADTWAATAAQQPPVDEAPLAPPAEAQPQTQLEDATPGDALAGETLPEPPGVAIDLEDDTPAWTSPWAIPSAEDIDPAQILRDRPDVYAAFYREYFGPNNDRNSDAWVDRVGGATPEDYARYWYKTYGAWQGYTPGEAGQGAPVEGAEAAGAVGRTTIDGVPLAKILADRPDVFQAFFTEYYGAGNDRHSDAWAQRVGGTTPEDYANYWYNAHGRLDGYVPSAPPPAPGDAQPPVEDSAPPPPVEEPAGGEGGAAQPTPAEPAPSEALVDPFVYSDPGAPMLPIVAGGSLFDDPSPFG